MQNSINSFNSAKAMNSTELLRKYNYLIDILSQQIRVLQADIANGITVDTTGKVAISLATTTTPGALSAVDWATFNNKQEKSIWGAL